MIVAVAVLLAAGCHRPSAPPVDDCDGPNMVNPRLAPSFPVDPDSLKVQITWDKPAGPDLPDSYFAAGVPYRVDGTLRTDVARVRLVSTHLLEVTLVGPAGTHGRIKLLFPDRRGFTRCSHPGMNDETLLRGNLRWVGDSPRHLIEDFFEEVHRGAI